MSSPSDKPDSLRVLTTWLKDNGVALDHRLELSYVGSKLKDGEGTEYSSNALGVFLKSGCALEYDEIVSTIPLSCVLSSRTTSCHLPNLPTTISYSHRQMLHLTLAVVHETLLGKKSRWWGYLRSLVLDVPPLAGFWSSGTRDWLRGTEVERMLNQAEYEFFTEEGLSDFFDHLLRPLLRQEEYRETRIAKMTYDDFRRALSLVSSRAFQVDAFHGLAMVPLADAYNHSVEPHLIMQSDDLVCPVCGALDECPHDDVSDAAVPNPPPHNNRLLHSSDSNQGTVEMVLTTPLFSGDGPVEVFNTYGSALSNAQLLVKYGFLIEANPNDRLVWTQEGLCEDLRTIREIPSVELAQLDKWLGVVKSTLLVRTVAFEGSVAVAPESQGNLDRCDRDIFFVDAEGRISWLLWAILSISTGGISFEVTDDIPNLVADQLKTIAQAQQRAEQAVDDVVDGSSDRHPEIGLSPGAQQHLVRLSQAVQGLCRRRIECLHKAESDLDDIFRELDDCPPHSEKRKAILNVINERNLLSACMETWLRIESCCIGSKPE